MGPAKGGDKFIMLEFTAIQSSNKDVGHLHEAVLDIEDSSLSNGIGSAATTTSITKLNKIKTQFGAFTFHYAI